MISVIIPMYNAEGTINRCIRSILCQSFADFEMIIIDDGSTDHGREIVLGLAETDGRIRYFRQDNGGVSKARNRGIEESCGEYLCFVDSDDAVREDYLLRLFNGIRESQSDIAICGYQEICGEQIKDIVLSSAEFNSLKGELKSDLFTLRRFINSPWMKIYVGETIRKNHLRFPENMTLAEDQFFNYQYFSLCRKVCFVNEAMYMYYISKTGLSEVVSLRCFENEMANLSNILSYVKNYQIENGESIVAEYICYCSRRYLFIPAEDNSRQAACRRLRRMNQFNGHAQLTKFQERLVFGLLRRKQYALVYWFYKIRRRTQ